MSYELLHTILFFLVIWHVSSEIVAMVLKPRIRRDPPWGGGNGCTLIGKLMFLLLPDAYAQKLTDKCCTPHDQAYFEGGWYFARWKADLVFFGHLVRHGGVLGLPIAILMFVGVRVGAAFSFGFGKKRSALPDAE